MRLEKRASAQRKRWGQKRHSALPSADCWEIEWDSAEEQGLGRAGRITATQHAWESEALGISMPAASKTAGSRKPGRVEAPHSDWHWDSATGCDEDWERESQQDRQEWLDWQDRQDREDWKEECEEAIAAQLCEEELSLLLAADISAHEEQQRAQEEQGRADWAAAVAEKGRLNIPAALKDWEEFKNKARSRVRTDLARRREYVSRCKLQLEEHILAAQQEQLLSARARIEALEATRSYSRAYTKSLLSRVAELERGSSAAKSQVASLRSRVAELERDGSAGVFQVASLLSRVAELEQEGSAAKSQVESLKATRSDSAALVKFLSRRVEDLDLELGSRSARVS